VLERTRSKRRFLPALLLAGALLIGAGVGAALAFDRTPPRPAQAGDLVDRPVPPLPLLDAAGRPTSLGSFDGRVVVLTPFLTLCHEVCPLTTGAFETMQRAVDAAGLGRRVVFAEVSVDPARDTPARLRAFARLTGVHLQLLTGTRSELSRFWHFFGVAYWRTPEGKPPDLDWLTGKPLTFDVSHTDGLFLIGPDGRERIVHVGMPRGQRQLPRVLLRLLNKQGRLDLAQPTAGWTPQDGLNDIGYLLKRHIPALGT
jgi:protein SCO1/2